MPLMCGLVLLPLSAPGDLPIYEIQGAAHISPYVGEEVSTRGYVTFLVEDGFYLQDPEGDGDDATSDGIFVFTGQAPAVLPEDWVELRGTVVEFVPGGPLFNNLSVTRLENPVTLPSTTTPPDWIAAGVLVGEGGRRPPDSIIDDDGMTVFDPETDGLDFYESLEGMLVTLVDPAVVCPSNPQRELYVVVDEGLGASGMSKRGTLKVSPDDYHPERIQIQEMGSRPDPDERRINVGDRLKELTGVLSYDGMYEVLYPHPVAMSPGGLEPATTTVTPHPERLRIASYSLAGLDAHVEDPQRVDQTSGDTSALVDDDWKNGRFAAIATHVVENLRAPDILALQEVQDNDGAEISSVTAADQTLQALVDAIVTAGGPVYQFVDSPDVAASFIDDNGTAGDPTDDEIVNPSGGQLGGNRRNAFLYNPERVFLGDSPANHPGGEAFQGAPLPLLATFYFQEEEPITLINVQLSDRKGGASLFGSLQPATDLQEDPLVNGGVDHRSAQAAVIKTLLEPPAVTEEDKLILLGNFNESEFLSPTLAFGPRVVNLTEMLPSAERYSTISQGSSLALDHVFVSQNLMGSAFPRYEVVHVNCEFAMTAARASDHDPVLVSLSLSNPLPFEPRTITGRDNNLLAPDLGSAGQPYLRTMAPSYEDSMNYPRGSSPQANPNPLVIMQSDLPSARHISNLLCQHPTGIQSTARLSSWTWQWGQFIDHDFGLTGGPRGDEPREFFPIPVPAGDPFFDPFATGRQLIPFMRSGVMPGTGAVESRETPNMITSYLDGSGVYGSDELRGANLRSFSGGRLATQPGPDGSLLPFNVYGRANANDVGAPEESLFLGGDVRANEQCALAAVHTLFAREHNRLAAEIAARHFANADLEDPLVDAAIYEQARKFVGAFIQSITFNEFLPAMMGSDPIPAYGGYDPQVDPSLAQEFANAAYRVGHTMVTPELLRLNENGRPLPEGHLSLRGAFFNPDEVTSIGISPYLRGLANQVQQEIDRFVIEDLRSFLFGPPGAGGLDLAALNIQRGRDHGIPSLNETREHLGLPRYEAYFEINPDPEVVAGFKAAYGPSSIDDVDLWIGGISEQHRPGSQLGETFHLIWQKQFTSMRDGDRFWYENDPFFTVEEIAEIGETSLSDIIRRNSDAEVQANVFFVPPARLVVTGFRFERSTNTVTMSWRSEGGESFEIQASDDFGRSMAFETVFATTGAPGISEVSFTDPAATGKTERAYRVIQRD